MVTQLVGVPRAVQPDAVLTGKLPSWSTNWIKYWVLLTRIVHCPALLVFHWKTGRNVLDVGMADSFIDFDTCQPVARLKTDVGSRRKTPLTTDVADSLTEVAPPPGDSSSSRVTLEKVALLPAVTFDRDRASRPSSISQRPSRVLNAWSVRDMHD